MSQAEKDLRAAFKRLKSGTPLNVPVGTPISQNNVAREAKKEPSAFKKSRYPQLIEEIQSYISCLPPTHEDSDRQKLLRKRKKNRDLKEQLRDVAKERDHALSLLVGADARILALYERVAELEARLPQDTVTKLALRAD